VVHLTHVHRPAEKTTVAVCLFISKPAACVERDNVATDWANGLVLLPFSVKHQMNDPRILRMESVRIRPVMRDADVGAPTWQLQVARHFLGLDEHSSKWRDDDAHDVRDLHLVTKFGDVSCDV